MAEIKIIGIEPCESSPGTTYVFEHEGETYQADRWYTNNASGLDCYQDGSHVPDPIDGLDEMFTEFDELHDSARNALNIDALEEQALTAAIEQFNA